MATTKLKIDELLNESDKHHILGEPIMGKGGVLEKSEKIAVGQVYKDKINNRILKILRLGENVSSGEPMVTYEIFTVKDGKEVSTGKKSYTSLDNFADSAEKEYILISGKKLEEAEETEEKEARKEIVIKFHVYFDGDGNMIENSMANITKQFNKAIDTDGIGYNKFQNIKDYNGNTVGQFKIS